MSESSYMFKNNFKEVRLVGENLIITIIIAGVPGKKP